MNEDVGSVVAGVSTPAAIVFGVGAEQGIGAAVCRRFAVGGHHLLVTGRTAAKIARVVATIEACGGSAEAVVTDVTDEASVIAAFDQAMQASGRHAPADDLAEHGARVRPPGLACRSSADRRRR